MGQLAFAPQGDTKNATVTTTAATITLDASALHADSLRLTNVGTQAVFVEISSAATAKAATVASSMPILPNSALIVTAARSTFVSVIATATGSALYVTPGTGV